MTRNSTVTGHQEEMDNGSKKNTSILRRIPARYVIAALGFLCVLTTCTLESILSVAIVSMVKPEPSDVGEGGNEEGEFSWDRGTQGLIQSSYYYGTLTTQVLGGYMAKRFGGKVVVATGLSLTGIFNILSPFAARAGDGGVYGFVALRVLQGMTCGVVVPSIHAIFSVWFPPEERSKFSSILFPGMFLGNLVGMVVSASLIQLSGWPLAFYFFGSFTVAITVPWCFLVFDAPHLHPRISPEECAFINDGLRIRPEDQIRKTFAVPWRQILLSPPVWACLFMFWGQSWVLFTLLSGLPTYMKNVLHYDIGKGSYLSSLPYLCNWSGALICGSVSQWLQKKKALSKLNIYRIFNGMATIGPALCLVAVTLVGDEYDAILAIFFVNGFFGGAIFGGSFVNHVDLSVNFAGILSGMIHTIYGIPGILTPSLIGYITQGKVTSSAQWNIVFYLGVGNSIFSYLFYILFGSVEEQSWNKPISTGEEQILAA